MPAFAAGILRKLLNFAAFFPQLHVFHLFAALALQGFAHERCVFFKAPLFAVFGRGYTMACQVTLGKNLETLATLEAGNGLFFDGLAGFDSHFTAVEFNGRFALCNSPDPLSHFLYKGGYFFFTHYSNASLRSGNFQRFFQIIVHNYPFYVFNILNLTRCEPA